MRIVAGKYKGHQLMPPKNITARPTTDFAKESLFNVLVNIIDFESTTVLDLFAGTGSISAEFLSRGAASVLSVDMANTQLTYMKKLSAELRTTNWVITKADVLQFLGKPRQQFSLIFADPPYMLPCLNKLPELVLNNSHLLPQGLFILEHPRQYDFSQHPQFLMHKKYGNVNFTIFQQ